MCRTKFLNSGTIRFGSTEKAIRRGRLIEEETKVDDTILMENLHLIDEDGYLIRTAMLAFSKDPEKWVTGSYIKKVWRTAPGLYTACVGRGI